MAIENVKNFLNTIKRDNLRLQYQYQISFYKEGNAPFDPQQSALKDAQIYAKSAQIPGKNIEMTEVQHHAMIFRIPNNVMFDGTMDMEVMADGEMKIHEAFNSWQDEFADLRKGGGGDKSIPLYNARIDLLTPDLKSVQKSYVIQGVFPSMIGPVELSQEAPDVAIFPLTLTFQYWYEDGKGDPLN